MSPKTITWIARSLDRIARALVLIAVDERYMDTDAEHTKREIVARDLYRDVFLYKPAANTDD